MAKTIAKATGCDNTRSKETHRLGSRCATGEANTWRTFSVTHIAKDGSGYFRLTRDGKVVHQYDWGPE